MNIKEALDEVKKGLVAYCVDTKEYYKFECAEKKVFYRKSDTLDFKDAYVTSLFTDIEIRSKWQIVVPKEPEISPCIYCDQPTMHIPGIGAPYYVECLIPACWANGPRFSTKLKAIEAHNAMYDRLKTTLTEDARKHLKELRNILYYFIGDYWLNQPKSELEDAIAWLEQQLKTGE